MIFIKFKKSLENENETNLQCKKKLIQTVINNS